VLLVSAAGRKLRLPYERLRISLSNATPREKAVDDAIVHCSRFVGESMAAAAGFQAGEERLELYVEGQPRHEASHIQR
jgi:hypothetical protein